MLTLIAFAGNSLLCRMALLPGSDGSSAIDPKLFTSLRLLSGALVLAPVLLRRQGEKTSSARPTSAAFFSLFIYAITFSESYVTVPAGIGALILFGVVQIQMIGVALFRGERLRPLQVLGFVLAIAGMLVLCLPSGADGAADVDGKGALLMVVAGIGWGAYTLLGRGAKDPVRVTAINFAYAAPGALVLGLIAVMGSTPLPTLRGVVLSIVCGAITSGLGYALWYTALRGHTRTSAAAVQLLVPIFASVGGFLLLGEEPTLRLAVSTVLVLGGVAAAILVPSSPST